MTNLFISYRRDDSGGHAGRLSDRLIADFGADRVFLDVQDIQPGENFQQAIEKTLARCDHLVAVIGPRWLAITQARRANGEDFVRHEISVALALGKTVIPVLVGGAEMPDRHQLPAEMAAFGLCQAVEIRDTCFDEDAGRLLAFLERGSKAVPSRPERLRMRRNLLLALTGALAAAAFSVWLMWLAPGKAAAAIDIDGEWVAELQRPGQAPFETRLTLAVMGDQVMGSVQYPTGGGPILDGRYVNGRMTFRTAHVPQSETQPATINLQARVEGDLMRLTIAYSDGVATGVAHRVGRQGNVATPPAVQPLLSEASEQRRRGQFVDALATLARARAQAPESDAVRQLQDDVALEWIRNVRVEGSSTTFADAIKPALTVIDAALASATGAKKADLQAHSGWAAFLMWRDGNRQLDPADWYRDALKTDPANPYANAMLAHWMLFRGEDVDGAVRLFEAALQSGRAKEAVRSLQWSALGNARTPESSQELVRLADALRRDAERLTARQAQTLWAPYYFALPPSRDVERRMLLDALPPDDHIKTLAWSFDDYAAGDDSRRQTLRYYAALLNERAGRLTEAREQLAALGRELAGRPGSLQDAVQASLRRLRR